MVIRLRDLLVELVVESRVDVVAVHACLVSSCLETVLGDAVGGEGPAGDRLS